MHLKICSEIELCSLMAYQQVLKRLLYSCRIVYYSEQAAMLICLQAHCKQSPRLGHLFILVQHRCSQVYYCLENTVRFICTITVCGIYIYIYVQTTNFSCMIFPACRSRDESRFNRTDDTD